MNKPIQIIKGIMGKIKKLLPGSDAKEGPLATLSQSGMGFVRTFSAGINKATPEGLSIVNNYLSELNPSVNQGMDMKGGAPGPSRMIVIKLDSLIGKFEFKGTDIKTGTTKLGNVIARAIEDAVSQAEVM